jgi:hypothetical protein
MIFFSDKPKIFVKQRVIHASIGQKYTLECQTEAFPNSGKHARRISSLMSSAKRRHAVVKYTTYS